VCLCTRRGVAPARWLELYKGSPTITSGFVGVGLRTHCVTITDTEAGVRIWGVWRSLRQNHDTQRMES